MVRHMCPLSPPSLLHINPIHTHFECPFRSVHYQKCQCWKKWRLNLIQSRELQCIHDVWTVYMRNSSFMFLRDSLWLDHWMYLGWESVSLACCWTGFGWWGAHGGLCGVAPEGRASVIMAINFCCWGNCFILLVHSGRHPNTPEQMMSLSTVPRTSGSRQQFRFDRPLFLRWKLNVKNTTEGWPKLCTCAPSVKIYSWWTTDK